jgi:hypothetical protein
MRSQRLFRICILALAVVVCWFVFADSALAQCAMCRGSFAGNSAFARNMNLGVLVLLAPPVSIFVAIFVIAFRHRKG